MKNFKTLIPVLLFTLAFTIFQSASANSATQNSKFALLGNSEAKGGVEVKANNKLELQNRLLNIGVGADVRADVKASTSVRRDNNSNASKSNSWNNKEEDDDHWDNRDAVKSDDNGRRPWFSWFGRIFGQSHNASSTTVNGTTTASTTASTTADTTKPMIYKKVRFMTASSTTSVTWNTNEQTYGEIRFATSSDALASNASSTVVVDGTLSTSHTLTLPTLQADTKYYAVITVRDASGNVTTSDIVKFKTKEGLTNATINGNLFMKLWFNIFG